MPKLNKNIIIEVADELDVSYASAERFLESEMGCYVEFDGERRWISGNLIARLLSTTK